MTPIRPASPDDPGWDEWIDYCAEVEDSEIAAWEEMTGRKLWDES